jgi:hypothetical protein
MLMAPSQHVPCTHPGAAGPVSTLAWHCSSNSQWTYPSVARATVNPPTDVSNCTALNNSTGLQGQQLRMVGISLAWQPAVTGMVSQGLAGHSGPVGFLHVVVKYRGCLSQSLLVCKPALLALLAVQGSVVDIVPICDWVTASTTSPPAPVPQIPQGERH